MENTETEQQNLGSGEKRRYINNRLLDENYIKSIGLKDEFYVIALMKHISDFIQNIPVKSYVGIDTKLKDRLYINVGQQSRCFFFDSKVSYYDFITMIKKWVRQFYPQYRCKVMVKRKYNDDEILEIKKKCDEEKTIFNLKEILDKEIEIEEIEYGIIEKIYLMQDSFVLKLNGKSFLYKTVTLDKKLALRIFMENLKNMMINKENPEKIRNYIFDNSVFVKKLEDKRVEIKYDGEMMLNFFRINKDEIKNKIIKDATNPLKWSWNKFDIQFDNKYLMDECIKVCEQNKIKIESA